MVGLLGCPSNGDAHSYLLSGWWLVVFPGGCTPCTIVGCDKKAKARGLCWTHGGGTKCQQPGCTKATISKGRCWVHGGGKRCLVTGCVKPAFERTHNFCQMHYEELTRDARVQDSPWMSFRPAPLDSGSD
jgi:hypothetical protein